MKTLIFFVILFFNFCSYANDCNLIEQFKLKNTCYEIKKIDVTNKDRSFLHQAANILIQKLIENPDLSLSKNDLYILFYDATKFLSEKEYNYLKIIISSAYVNYTNIFNISSLFNHNLALNNIEKFKKAIAVELSLPPYLNGSKVVNKIFNNFELWAFYNSFDDTTYVLENDSNKILKLFFYDKGLLIPVINFCRDKNIFLGPAHKNKEFNKFEACFRFNGERPLNSSASQICFDQHYQGLSSQFETGSGYDSYDNVGIARGFDNSKIPKNYYCKYNPLELISHGFKDLLPYLLKK